MAAEPAIGLKGDEHADAAPCSAIKSENQVVSHLRYIRQELREKCTKDVMETLLPEAGESPRRDGPVEKPCSNSLRARAPARA